MGGKVSKKNRQLLTIIGLCVLLIALIIVFFVATKHKDNSEKKEEAENNIELYSIKESDIAELHFKNSTAELTFVKNKNKWVLKDDTKYSLDQSKVETLVSDVKNMSATSEVTQIAPICHSTDLKNRLYRSILQIKAAIKRH